MATQSWKQISLDEVTRKGDIQLGRGNIISSIDIACYPGQYPIYSSSAKGNGEFGRYSYFMFDEELITWSIDGGGRFFYRPKHKFSVTNVSGYMRAESSKWNLLFVYYLLDFQHKKIAFDYQTKAHPSVIKNLYYLLEISTQEQKQIAEILSTIDRAIAQTEALIAKQQRIKTGLMQDLLTKGIDENGNIRSEATHQFKDSAIGRIPVEWDIQGLASLLENIYQGWSPDCESDSASEDEWGVLKTTSVTWDGYDSQENKKLPNFLKPRPSLEIKKGDVLITRAGPNSRVGVICYVYETLSKKILSDKIYKLKFNENLEPRFFVYSLSGSASQQYLSTLKTGMAESQTNISQEIVKKVLTVIPSDQEQIAIANLLDENLQSYQEHLLIKNKLYLIKTGLMQDLLTGKVRVTNLLKEREPTSL
jgi:type I restriction enzyme S subunit